MSIFFWRDNKALDEFSISLADGFHRKFPPQKIAEMGASRNARRVVEGEVEHILHKLAEYKKAHQAGIYKSARLQNTFTYRMKELGYPEEIIKMFGQLILTKAS